MRRQLLTILLLCGSAWATACPAGYLDYVSVTVQAQSGTSTNQTNFPMLFIGSALFKTVGNGGNVQSSSGLDVVFCTNFTGGTLLPYELVANTYTPTSGAGEWWVQVPTVSHTTTEVIYALVNKSAATDQSCGPSGSNNCGSTLWSNYIRVWHYGSSATLVLTDSTGNATSPTNNNAHAAAGPISAVGSACFNNGLCTGSGGTDNIDTGSALPSMTNFTVETWQEQTDAGSVNVLVSNSNSTATQGFFLLNVGTQTNCPGSIVCPGGGYQNSSQYWRYQTSVVGTTGWTQTTISHTAGSTNVTVYSNAVALTTSCGSCGAATDPATSATDLFLGKFGAFTSPDYFSGYLWETRIATAVLAADWITDGFNSQNSPNTFYSLGSLTPISGGAAPPCLWVICE